MSLLPVYCSLPASYKLESHSSLGTTGCLEHLLANLTPPQAVATYWPANDHMQQLSVQQSVMRRVTSGARLARNDPSVRGLASVGGRSLRSHQKIFSDFLWLTLDTPRMRHL